MRSGRVLGLILCSEPQKRLDGRSLFDLRLRDQALSEEQSEPCSFVSTNPVSLQLSC